LRQYLASSIISPAVPQQRRRQHANIIDIVGQSIIERQIWTSAAPHDWIIGWRPSQPGPPIPTRSPAREIGVGGKRAGSGRPAPSGSVLIRTLPTKRRRCVMRWPRLRYCAQKYRRCVENSRVPRSKRSRMQPRVQRWRANWLQPRTRWRPRNGSVAHSMHWQRTIRPHSIACHRRMAARHPTVVRPCRWRVSIFIREHRPLLALASWCSNCQVSGAFVSSVMWTPRRYTVSCSRSE
jgi:hypothetical protein